MEVFLFLLLSLAGFIYLNVLKTDKFLLSSLEFSKQEYDVKDIS